ncbi:c-type cytochrome [Chitinophaga sp. Cy-1792]|uniref:DUF7133 domain-containing protein n=1 Tax=Chitinophaga sp. Cy-1792 TaxID=2608339 RepID=UPI001421835C|nr:c-type cytochrome [Chitinophaga sp. Cy-1792]NIG55270.1 c-type cytochrome [Chitinophaga sp. Cy-1792]
MNRKYYLIFSTLMIAFIASCHQNHSTSATSTEDTTEAPVLDAKAAIGKMKTDKDLEVQLVAAEPMVVAPVAMTFDISGRMWVAEMMGYMPDTLGTGEDKPDGKIVILTDKNGDGVMDERTVFLDSLVLPRALCLVDSGILVATPPMLWYYEIHDDKPGKRTLVDDQYAAGGNVEHQPNGLYRALDNWIYSAKSDRRYRRINGKWVKEMTHFRGQWGISQDDDGRLFYNNNSQNLLGDYFAPGLGANNPHQQKAAGFDEKIVKDNRVYPIRPNRGVNRGYVKGVLDSTGRLVEFTAACGPLIYRAGHLGLEYYGNAFVAEPAANLIKRNILKDSGLIVTGEQSSHNSEFLASTDERFRPVNLYTGTDGALYILDMYRGIIQHKSYLTSYLKQQIATRKLTLPLNCGRIYRVIKKGEQPQKMLMRPTPNKLVASLHDNNGVIRDLAQQQLVDRNMQEAVPALREMLKDTLQLLGLRHALWTLEGLHQLKLEDITFLLATNEPICHMQAMAALPAVMTPANSKQANAIIDSLLHQENTVAYAAWLLPDVARYNKSAAATMEDYLVKTYAGNRYVAAAIVNNATNREAAILKSLDAAKADTASFLYKGLKATLEDMQSAAVAKKMEALELTYPKGHDIFTTLCQTCHGKKGNGIASMAPPLNESNWVNGEKEHLISIVLYGLTGPVKVQNKIYQAPEISGDMPGIGGTGEYSNEDIAQLISYIRNAWKNNAEKVTVNDIIKVREKNSGRQKPFTAAELTQ